MKFSKYQRSISLTLLVLLGIGSTLPAVGSGSVSTDKLTKLGPDQEVLLAQIRRRRKPLKYTNLDVKAPTERKSRFGATRGGVCQENQQTKVRNIRKDLIALLPPNFPSLTSQKTDKIQLTTSAHPTVLFYLPENSATTASFYLCKNNSVVYEALDFSLPNQTSNNAGGVVILNLANVAQTQNLPELKVGENYLWQVKLADESNATRETPKIGGWMRRIDPKIPLGQQLATSLINRNKLKASLVIANELKKVEPIDYPLVYAENGIWYSAINTLVELIQTNPQDPQIKKDWEGLLTSVNLTEIARKPIIGSATIKDVEVNNQ